MVLKQEHWLCFMRFQERKKRLEYEIQLHKLMTNHKAHLFHAPEKGHASILETDVRMRNIGIITLKSTCGVNTVTHTFP